MIDFDDIEKLSRSPFVAGFFGSVITAVKFTPGVTWVEKSINVVAGALVAGYVSPALVQYLGLSSDGYKMGAAFVIGLLGLSVAAAVIQGIRGLKLADIITGWISRREQ